MAVSSKKWKSTLSGLELITEYDEQEQMYKINTPPLLLAPSLTLEKLKDWDSILNYMELRSYHLIDEE